MFSVAMQDFPSETGVLSVAVQDVPQIVVLSVCVLAGWLVSSLLLRWIDFPSANDKLSQKLASCTHDVAVTCDEESDLEDTPAEEIDDFSSDRSASLALFENYGMFGAAVGQWKA